MLKRLTTDNEPQWLRLLGLALALLLIASKIHMQSLERVLEPIVVLLGFFSMYRYGSDIKLKIPMLLLAASILIPLLSWTLVHFAEPDWARPSPQLEKLARLFVFIPLAWWLKNSSRHIFIFWGLAALTVLASPWISGHGLAEIERGLNGARIGFNLRNAQHTSLFFGLVLVGLVVFAPRLFKWQKLTMLLWLPALALTISAIIGAQTRASWLALVATALVCALVFVWSLAKGKMQIQKRWLALGAFAIITIGITLQHTAWPVVKNRLANSGDNKVALQILSGEFDNIPYNSWGVRANTWIGAAQHIAERPLTGWGGTGQSISIRRSAWLPEYIRNGFGHLHNIYLALLVNYGIIGFGFYLVWVGWILKSLLNATRQQPDIGYFAIGTFTFWSVISLAESYLFFWTGVFCIQTLFAGFLAFTWLNPAREDNTCTNPVSG
ncbi:O-antigen ligase family protein [Maribrevibacterium harenarium]|uniref:O-antigen ligase family protein n=1 Tax=Maribrevibacterium harenarium TaxID=2589817 RepID=A0A501WYD9_9GAMM|nr:O-antigen ligase family protein [Maribrevibacterium harenarium]TPE54279.1 O-antigen ligase family protein [Maribrevibacterium harenarium]